MEGTSRRGVRKPSGWQVRSLPWLWRWLHERVPMSEQTCTAYRLSVIPYDEKEKRQATRHKRVKVLSGYFIKKDTMANKGIKGAQPLFIREIQHKTIKSHNFTSTRLAKTFLKSVIPARGRKQSMEPPKFMGLALRQPDVAALCADHLLICPGSPLGVCPRAGQCVCVSRRARDCSQQHQAGGGLVSPPRPSSAPLRGDAA